MEASRRRDSGDVSVASSIEVEAYKAERAHELMLNEATSAFEHAAIAPLLLLNGGGTVAFLTLLGAVSDPKARFSASIGWAVAATVVWAVSLVLAALSASFGLISQRAFSKKHRIERQAMERLLLEHSAIVKVVAPSVDGTDWTESSGSALERAKRFQDLYEIARWASIAGFVIGVGCAATSVA